MEVQWLVSSDCSTKRGIVRGDGGEEAAYLSTNRPTALYRVTSTAGLSEVLIISIIQLHAFKYVCS